jgi:Membrane bound FAD containing D-sorbitol dehydrogenase
MKIQITRRQLALGLLAALGGGGAIYWQRVGQDGTAVDLDLPPSRNPFAPEFDEFLALSQIVLMRSNLDKAGARKLYDVFVEEPWGPKHIGHAYAVLRRELAQTRRHGGAVGPLSLSRLEDGERWFVKHLLTTWYLGVYYHAERPTQRLLYDEALMFDAIRGVIPVPFLEATGFGAWAEPPSTDGTKT